MEMYEFVINFNYFRGCFAEFSLLVTLSALKNDIDYFLEEWMIKTLRIVDRFFRDYPIRTSCS